MAADGVNRSGWALADFGDRSSRRERRSTAINFHETSMAVRNWFTGRFDCGPFDRRGDRAKGWFCTVLLPTPTVPATRFMESQWVGSRPPRRPLNSFQNDWSSIVQ